MYWGSTEMGDTNALPVGGQSRAYLSWEHLLGGEVSLAQLLRRAHACGLSQHRALHLRSCTHRSACRRFRVESRRASAPALARQAHSCSVLGARRCGPRGETSVIAAKIVAWLLGSCCSTFWAGDCLAGRALGGASARQLIKPQLASWPAGASGTEVLCWPARSATVFGSFWPWLGRSRRTDAAELT